MKLEEIRIKMAECLGWTFDKSRFSGHECVVVSHPSHGTSTGRLEQVSAMLDLLKCPNYPEDLNACHAAEKTLNKEQQKLYADCLYVITGLGTEQPNPHSEKELVQWFTRAFFQVATATAMQRCEAFLRVKSLWVEQSPNNPLADLKGGGDKI